MQIEQKLRQEIETSPVEVRMKFKDLGDQILFNGFIFKDGKVFCRNIYLYELHNNLRAIPLEVTNVFIKYNDIHTIINLCDIILPTIRNYYKDCEFTFYITPLIGTLSNNLKPKLQYELEKHKGRYKPFITSNKKANIQFWCNLLCSAVEKRCNDPRRKWS